MDNLKQKTISGFAYKFLERAGAQAVKFIVSLVLARILLPEEYGKIAIVLLLINFLDVFVTYGFGNSLIADKNSDDVDFSTCFYFGIIISLLVYGLLFVFSDSLAEFFETPSLSIVFKVMGLRIPIAAVNSVQQAYVSKNMMFKKFFISTSIGTVLSGVIAIVMAYNNFGIWALVEQYLGNVVCDTICLWIIVGWRPIKAFSLNSLKRIYNYGWKILVVGLIDRGYTELRSVIIAKKYSSSDLAYYDKGNQFPGTILSVIEPTVNGVLFPALSQCQDDQDRMRNVTRRMIMTSCYILFPIMIGLICVAKPLVIVLLKEKWLPCVVFLQLGCIGNMLRPLQFINNCVIKASGNSGLLLKLNIVKKTIGIVLLIISIQYGVVGIALSLVITDLISTMINIFPNRTILKYGYRKQFLDIVSSSIISIGMGIVIFPIKFLPFSPIVILIIQIVLGVMIYWFLSKITHNEIYEYLLSSIKMKKNKDR